MAQKLLKRELVVVEEGTLSALAGNAAALAEFPFLKNLARRERTRCGRCSRANGERAANYGSAKQSIASLDSAKKNRLKQLLNANKLRITYKLPSGKLMQLTF